MKLTRRLHYLRGPLDPAPAIAIVLLLLVFFMLGTNFVLQPGIKIDLPRSPWGAGISVQGPIVTVLLSPEQRDANGQPLPRQPLLFFNDEIVKLPDLGERLQRITAGRAHPGQSLMIKADIEVPQGIIVEIMNLAMAQKWTVVLATRRTDAEPSPSPSPAAPTPAPVP